MKQKDFGERLNAARDAKQAMVAKFRQQPGPDDPAVAERRAARVAMSEARDTRLTERKAQRLADNARMAAESEALAAEQAEQEVRATAQKAEDDIRLEAERKAARDARYAARKARK
ncbi:DUF6481 family protein [Microvirga sp. 2YAF29]|uniref:DUF6481 family protein n=1 Tax=Microvirga sp. 2YAF29 TaxID=3233031 RepID=UPI003F9C62F2